MSEPTPLSAERALNLLRMAARVDPLLRRAVADVELHIDAQATEIAALRAVSSQQQQRAQLAEGKLEGYRQALADAADHMPRAHEGIGKALVLAGKEAQGGSIERKE